eukprot:scaffold210392_cov23-Tisochrysis_lutea.AAC.1
MFVQDSQLRIWRGLAPCHSDSELKQPRGTGRRLRVAAVGLHASNRQPHEVAPMIEDRCRHRSGFNGVSERCASPMRLNDRDVLGCHSSICQGGANEPSLRLAVGRGQRGRLSVLTHAAAEDSIVGIFTRAT